MFDVSKIQANLTGLVGWRQPLNPTYAILDASNVTSSSGEYVTDNPYCKTEYIYDSQDYDGISDADFNNYLRTLHDDSVISVCHSVFSKSDFIDRQILYPYTHNRVNTETLNSGFVAIKIEQGQKKNLAFEITRVLLDFEGAGDIKILLFNTFQSAPIKSQTVTITSNHQEVVLNWKLDNSGDLYKGDYYLGYLTNAVGIGTLKPYKRDYEKSDIMANIKFLDIDTVEFKGQNTEVLQDLNSEESMSQTTGLNPDITVYEDYTDLITQNKSLFARAVNLDLQIKCMEIYMASLRSNLNERKSERKLLMMIQLIEGANASESVVKVTGLRPQLSRAISSIRKEIFKLQDGYYDKRISVITLK